MRPLAFLALAQAALAVPVVTRLIRSAGGRPLPATAPEAPGAVSVIVPVLNEAQRLGPCLAHLSAAGATVREILVVDGGSHDATREVVRDAETTDARVRWIDAAPVPPGWNGKAWGLDVGLAAADRRAAWILTIDADVRVSASLPAALVEQAARERLGAVSVATHQELADGVQAVVHPAFLATLVYRYGAPGSATSRVRDVQANGQCFLARRDALTATHAFERARTSRAEDVTAARVLAHAGERVGFYEVANAARVRMHDDWRATWRDWPRSLPLRDEYTRLSLPLDLATLALVQALPLPLAAILTLRGERGVARALNVALAAVRLGMLAGMRRAYVAAPPAYWLSPLADLPAVTAIALSALRRRHTWRGRVLVPEHAA